MDFFNYFSFGSYYLINYARNFCIFILFLFLFSGHVGVVLRHACDNISLILGCRAQYHGFTRSKGDDDIYLRSTFYGHFLQSKFER